MRQKRPIPRLMAGLRIVLTIGLGLGLAAGLLSAQEKLTPDEKRWLEDVTPIMTKTERDVFLKLRTAAERAKFQVFFWRSRDPSPDTPENEFQKDYMARVKFADENFGHDTPKRGSQTDRGYFYLVLGRPQERNLFTTESQVWPLELWFYKGAEEYGLPAYFYLLFYQPQALGDYRLYYPGVEGPETLVVPQTTVDTTRASAIQTLRGLNSELGAASQSYLPGERAVGFTSSSENIIASIRQFPDKKFTDSYARTYMDFKDFIETDYTDRYLESACQVKVFETGGQPFVHWAIEPERMNVAATGNTVYAAFEFILRVEDDGGRTVFERTDEIPLKMTGEQYKSHERRRFAFQDMLPLIPGQYKALFLLKNRTSKDFSTYEARVTIPPSGQAGLSVPILYHTREGLPQGQAGNLKAFVFDGYQYVVGARNEFLTTETLGVFFQAWNVDRLHLEAAPSFGLEIFSVDTGASIGSFPLKDVNPNPRGGSFDVNGSFALSTVTPGYYRAEVSAFGPDGRKVLAGKENFVVLGRTVPVVPWVYARLHGPFPGAEHLKTLGGQYFLAGDYRRALEVLASDERLKQDPGSNQLAAKSLYALGRFKDSLDLALPLYAKNPDRETGKVIALDYAGLKDWTSCLAVLEKLMSEATEVSVLNLTAQCYLSLGRPDRALPILQKSLSLLPGQADIKALEEQTRKTLEKK